MTSGEAQASGSTTRSKRIAIGYQNLVKLMSHRQPPETIKTEGEQFEEVILLQGKHIKYGQPGPGGSPWFTVTVPFRTSSSRDPPQENVYEIYPQHDEPDACFVIKFLQWIQCMVQHNVRPLEDDDFVFPDIFIDDNDGDDISREKPCPITQYSTEAVLAYILDDSTRIDFGDNDVAPTDPTRMRHHLEDSENAVVLSEQLKIAVEALGTNRAALAKIEKAGQKRHRKIEQGFKELRREWVEMKKPIGQATFEAHLQNANNDVQFTQRPDLPRIQSWKDVVRQWYESETKRGLVVPLSEWPGTWRRGDPAFYNRSAIIKEFEYFGRDEDNMRGEPETRRKRRLEEEVEEVDDEEEDLEDDDYEEEEEDDDYEEEEEDEEDADKEEEGDREENDN
ncbi:hypothetical protein BGZ59_007763 [Podila verticillata]|nr:hypothetical protein BGZ59_007763 [Podila verticillata]